MASASSVRGQLLREVTALSDQILETQSQFTAADAKLRAQQESVELVQAQIKQAEADLAALEAQRKFESENDLEFMSLQRAVSGLTQRKHDLIRLTKAARNERDKLKEEARSQYYTRMGLLMEAQSIAVLVERSEREADVVRPALPLMTSDSNWTTESVALFADYDGLWKKISAHEETIRDLVDATLSLHNLAIPPIVSPPVLSVPTTKPVQRAGSASEYVDTPSSSASGTLLISSTTTARAAQSMYATFGAEFIASEAQKAVDAIHGFETSLSGLSSRVDREISRTAAIHTSLHAGHHLDSPAHRAFLEEAPHSDKSPDLGDGESGMTASLLTLRTLGMLLDQNLQMQSTLLDTIMTDRTDGPRYTNEPRAK